MSRPVGVPEPVVARAPAKVNLHLAVGDLRDDGYHDLVTVFLAVSLFDQVTVTPARGLGLTVRGEGALAIPRDHRNLAWKAAVAVAERAGVDPEVHIELHKEIPVAAGLAGGSADAAATMVACDALWGAGLHRDELVELAGRLGSDVAFALNGGIALGTGRGEQVTPVLAGGRWHWVLAIAHGGLSTPEVYAELDRLREQGRAPRAGSADTLINALRTRDLEGIGASLVNDMEPATLSLRADLRRTLRVGEELGAVGALIAGSGPTCVFLARSADSAVKLAASLAGAGVCRTVRTAYGPVPGARVTA